MRRMRRLPIRQQTECLNQMLRGLEVTDDFFDHQSPNVRPARYFIMPKGYVT
jgi:hypothetical protein